MAHTGGGGVEERMNRETSVYLDLVRFVAAVFVSSLLSALISCYLQTLST